MKETFTGKIRLAAQALGEDWGGFSVDQVCDQAMIQTYKDKKRVRNAILELYQAGELERIGNAIYRLREQPPGKPQIQEIMWKILRARRTVTLEDMEELAGASPTYATEWLQMLVRRKIVRHLKNGNPSTKTAGKWQMVTDPGPAMPLNDEKAERLRNLRAKKKEALDAMDRAFVAIAEARMAMSEMGAFREVERYGKKSGQ